MSNLVAFSIRFPKLSAEGNPQFVVVNKDDIVMVQEGFSVLDERADYSIIWVRGRKKPLKVIGSLQEHLKYLTDDNFSPAVNNSFSDFPGGA